MTFKLNDLVLCVDARGLAHCTHPVPREGRTYVVSAVETCCVTRVGLVEVPVTYGLSTHCLTCGAAHVTRANFYARRFVKIGEQGAKDVRVRRTADEVLRDSFYDDVVRYLTKEV